MALPSAALVPDDDRRLLDLVTRGDEPSLVALFDRYAGPLHAMALRITTERADADAVVLDAFQQAWRDAAPFEAERGSVAAWLTMKCRSRALDLVRSRGRRDRAVGRALSAAPNDAPAMGRPAENPGLEVGERGRPMNDGDQEIRDLAPAYVVGALRPEETRAFDAALARDPELQREVSALLADSSAAAPPAGLRERLIQRVHDEKHLAFPVRPESRRSMLPVLLGFGLAASVLLAVGLALKTRQLSRDLAARDSVLAVRDARLAARERTLNGILEPGVELTLLSATGELQPGVQLFRDRDRNVAIIHAFRLKPAPTGRAYQLWIIPLGGGNPIPSQVFNSDPDGHALVENVAVPADVTVEMYVITEEPAGGSPQPTSAPFLLGRVGP